MRGPQWPEDGVLRALPGGQDPLGTRRLPAARHLPPGTSCSTSRRRSAQNRRTVCGAKGTGQATRFSLSTQLEPFKPPPHSAGSALWQESIGTGWSFHQLAGARQCRQGGGDVSCAPVAHLDSVTFLLSPWQTFSSCT